MAEEQAPELSSLTFWMLDQGRCCLSSSSGSTFGAAQGTCLGCSILTAEDSDVESSLTEAQ